jgi:ubiquinone/menaquinone biosynthesis C-methylase UbiE
VSGGATPSASSRAAAEKQERLARAYDADIWPIYAGRFAAAALRLLSPRPAARVVEVGCATGLSTLELARRFGDSRVSAFDEAPAAVAQARARVDGDAQARGRVTLEVAAPAALPVADGEADVAVSNLAVAEADDPPAAVRELVRTLAPGGQAVITLALRGTWAEFLDVYRDVLREQGKRDSAGALERYVAALPDGDTAARWLQAAGLAEVEVAALRWEILFKSTREFFFAPLVELGPLSRWKQIAGRGDDMQDIFFFTKEALDAYFKGMVLPMTVVGATVTGRRPP